VSVAGDDTAEQRRPVGVAKDTRASVDVVIPTYDASELVRRCLGSLAADPTIARLIVVDDASGDDTRMAVAAEFPAVELVVLGEHRGLAHALNRGAAAGSAELVLFLNNDVLASERAVTRLAAALLEDASAVCAGGCLVDPGSSRVQDAYQPRALPRLAGLLTRISGLERVWPRNPWTGQHLRAPLDQTRTGRTGRQPAGACLLVRRAALERIGGWDERYWLWYEDVDLARRLEAIGPALYVPGARFEHVGRSSTSSWRKHEQRARLYHGTIVYGQGHLARIGQVALGLALLVACLPRVAIARVRRSDAAGDAYAALCLDAARMVVLLPARAPDFDRGRPA
jgi:N-acetylglucosaminyl-diphospho-decaprenol L-rhamnosyltransferase